MTTIFGIRHNDLNAAVIAGDRQVTIENTQKAPFSKLYVGDSGDYAFGLSGTLSSEVHDLTQKLKQGKIDVEKIIAEGNFHELREMNIEQMGNRRINNEKETGMLLATRFNKDCNLYTCWPLGGVEQRDCTYIGSGSRYVEEYLNAIGVANSVNPQNRRGKFSIEKAIEIGLQGVKYAASKDLYSNGLNLAVITPEGIGEHSRDLEDNSFKRKLRKIQKQYKENSK